MFALEVIWGSPSGGLALVSVLFPRDMECIFGDSLTSWAQTCCLPASTSQVLGIEPVFS